MGLLAQDLLEEYPDEVKEEMHQFVIDLFDELIDNEIEFTRDVYQGLDVVYDVIEFVKYNANKALNNLGLEARYEVGEVNPIVINGLDTKSKSHDFFSTKGNSYKKAIVEPITNDCFIFD